MGMRKCFFLVIVLVACGQDTYSPVDSGPDSIPTVGGGSDGSSCEGGQAACGTTCVDTQTDARNCGSCGHDCLGGTCTSAVCQPFTIAQGQAAVTRLVPNGTKLYWSRSATGVQTAGVYAADLDGQNAATLYDAGGGKICNGLLVSASDSYFFCTGAIYDCQLPSCSSSPSSLTSVANVADTAFDTTNDRIYFSVRTPYNSQTGGYIASIPTIGGTPSRLVSADQPNPANLIIDGGNVYWLDVGTYLNDLPQHDGGVRSATLGTSQSSSIVAADGASYNYSGLALGGTTVYYGAGDSYEIHSVATTGGSPSTYATSLASAPIAEIVTDATYVYWTEAVQLNGGVYRCAKASCTTPTALATKQDAPQALAQDAVSIYWANDLGGEIRRLAK
jgi:hypothetical protein